MIKVETNADVTALKQIVLFGILVSVVIGGIVNSMQIFKMPYSADIGGWISWVAIFLIGSAIIGVLAIVLLVVVTELVKKFWK